MRIPCICPPKGEDSRHPDGDEIGLREKLDFRAITTIRWAVAVLRETEPGASLAEMLALISENYVLLGIESWTVVDEKGKPVEPTKAAIRERLLPTIAAQAVADAAEGLYQAVMLPLLEGASTSSPPTPTDDSTSPTTGSTPRKPSKRSSISTIPTVGTEATASSLDGDFNSSPSSATAA